METSGLPEPLRARMAELDAMSSLEIVREFLRGNVADAESLGEIRRDLQQLAQITTRAIHRDLAALEAVLAEPPAAPGTLARLVGWDANWVLEDPSDAGAARFLRELAEMLREVIAEAE